MKALLALVFSFFIAGAAFAGEPRSPKDIPLDKQHVKLMIRVCLIEHPEACENREIVNSDSAVEDQPLNMASCQGYQGQVSVMKYVEQHVNQLKGYKFGGIVCEFGNRMPPDRERKA